MSTVEGDIERLREDCDTLFSRTGMLKDDIAKLCNELTTRIVTLERDSLHRDDRINDLKAIVGELKSSIDTLRGEIGVQLKTISDQLSNVAMAPVVSAAKSSDETKKQIKSAIIGAAIPIVIGALFAGATLLIRMGGTNALPK